MPVIRKKASNEDTDFLALSEPEGANWSGNKDLSKRIWPEYDFQPLPNL